MFPCLLIPFVSKAFSFILPPFFLCEKERNKIAQRHCSNRPLWPSRPFDFHATFSDTCARTNTYALCFTERPVYRLIPLYSLLAHLHSYTQALLYVLLLCYRAFQCCSGKKASVYFLFSRAKFQRKLIVAWYSKDAGVSSFALANPENVGISLALKSLRRLTSICPRPFKGTQEGVPVTTCEVLCAA